MVNLQHFSKKVGFFRKERALAVVVTVSEVVAPEQDFAQFREGFTKWVAEFGSSCKELLFTFMAEDAKQPHVLGFFKLLLDDAEVSDLLSGVQMRLQFPSMSKAAADDTHARIYAKEL
jgi:hypothetical protein